MRLQQRAKAPRIELCTLRIQMRGIRKIEVRVAPVIWSDQLYPAIGLEFGGQPLVQLRQRRKLSLPYITWNQENLEIPLICQTA